MSKTKEISTLFGIYLLSSLFLILNFDGLYWDDWAAVNQTTQTIDSFMGMIQHGLKGVFVKFMLSFENQIYPTRIFLFFAYFITAVLVYFILQNIKELTKKDIFYISLLYLVTPVMSSKIALSIIPFVLPLLIFYVTFFILTKQLKTNSLILRAIVLAGFFASFDTNSILVFYATVLMYIFYIKYEFKITISNIKIFTLKYFDFIVLPIIFFVIKTIYFKPYGIYEGYNSLGESSIFKVLFKLIKSLDTSIFNVLHQSFYISLPFWLLIASILFILIKKGFVKKEDNLNPNSKNFLYVGFMLFFLAVFPYVAVSKLPVVDSFSSRFQLLTPLGLAFVFYFGINLLVKYLNLKNVFKYVLLLTLICSFIGKNLYNYYKWQIDSLYMTSIMMNFKENNTIKNNKTFVVNNNIISKLMYERKPPFYEYNGMLKKVFKDDSRLMIKYKEYKNLNKIKKSQQYLQYNFSTWSSSKPILVTISHNYKYKAGNSRIAKLMLMRFKNYEQYLIDVKRLTVIATEEL